MTKINFADVKSFEPIDAGDYLATVVEAKAGTSESKHDKFDLQWKIEGGKFDGRRVFDTLSFHPDSQFRIKQTLIAFGYDQNFAGDVTADMFMGKTAVIRVTIRQSDPSKVDPATNEPYPPRNVVKKTSAPTKTAVPTEERKRGFLRS